MMTFAVHGQYFPVFLPSTVVHNSPDMVDQELTLAGLAGAPRSAFFWPNVGPELHPKRSQPTAVSHRTSASHRRHGHGLPTPLSHRRVSHALSRQPFSLYTSIREARHWCASPSCAHAAGHGRSLKTRTLPRKTATW